STSRPRATLIRDAEARSSASDFPSSATVSIPLARRRALQLFAQGADRRLHLGHVAAIVAVHRRNRVLGAGVQLFGLVAKRRYGLLELQDVVFCGRNGLADSPGQVLALGFERVAQRRRRLADLPQLVFAEGLRLVHGVLARGALAFELLAQRHDRFL